MLRSDQYNDRVRKTMVQTLQRTGQWQGAFWNRHKDGRNYVISMSVNAVYDSNHNITNYISVFYDITEQKKQQQTLEKRANFDLLKGLRIRAWLFERLLLDEVNP